MTILRSRENPRVRRWTKLVQDARYRRSERRAVLEGPNLLEAHLDSGGMPVALFATEAGLAKKDILDLVQRANTQPVMLPQRIFASIVDSETPQGIAVEIALPSAPPDLARSRACVFLEGVQDAGNVGAILRSAAAFGIDQVVLARGCADAWSPKVLRAAAGAHFQLGILDQAELLEAIELFAGKLLCAMPRNGVPLREADLEGRLGWIFGGEGHGISPPVAERADIRATIPIAAQAESLNVATAAAICLYETACRHTGHRTER